MANTGLSRTFGTPTNNLKWTFSAWIKRSNVTTTQNIFSARIDGSNFGMISINSSGYLDVASYIGGFEMRYITNRVFRDVSAWYHIFVSNDSSLASPETKIYINGVLETSFSTSNAASQNEESMINKSGVAHWVGQNGNNQSYFDGSMAMVQFVDGTALGPEYFGSTDSTTGIWTPQASSIISSYGANGFKLKMDTATPGADTSGNTNTFTVGTGTPTLTQGSPSNVYATWNPLSALTTPPTFSNGNTTAAVPTSGGAFRSTLAASSGKWYCEVKVTTLENFAVGIQPIDSTYNVSIFADSSGIGLYGTYGEVYKNGSNIGAVASVSNNDIIGMAIDLDNNNIYFSKNGQYASGIGGSWNQSFGSAYAVAINSGNTYTVAAVNGSSGTTSNVSINFGEGFFGTTAAGTEADDNGQGLFAYDVPAGYYALNTKNLEAYG